MNTCFPICVLLSICLALNGCSESGETTSTVEVDDVELESTIALDNQTASDVRRLIGAYLTQIDIDFSEANNDLQTFTTAVNEFLEMPSPQGYESLRSTWLDAHNGYEASAIHRFFAQVILTENTALSLLELQYQLDQWPILPGYIDYVSNYPESGIVNDMTVSLDSGVIREQHGRFDINEASTGFHVIEFLLWGENSEDTSLRPYTDYEPVTALSSEQRADGLELFQLSDNRRREYLSLSANILNEDFQSLVNSWAANSVGYRAAIANTNAEQLLLNLLNAITNMLNEELLLRSLYPMLNGDLTESLPAIYSRSSPAAVSAQLAGLENLLLASDLESGINFDGILSELSEDFAEFFYQNFDASKECLVVLYATDDVPQSPEESTDLEFKVVECINSLTNMIDYLEQIKLSLNMTG